MKRIKRLTALALCLCLACMLVGCGDGKEEKAAELSFSAAVNIEQIKALNGKTVSVNGYMATLSPISGKFMYLMNMPYQSCPFCQPNTTVLSNTMAVYAPEGKSFAFTDQAIRVTGRLEVGSFTDEFSYEYNYRIADARYEVIALSAVSEEHALWTSLAADGVVADVNSMFDYVFFLCAWPDYEGRDSAGNTFFFYPGDAELCLEGTGMIDFSPFAGQGYFDSLAARVKAVDADRLNDLVDIIRKAEAVARRGREALESQAYFCDTVADRFYLNEGEALLQAFYDAYNPFCEWMARWEL